MTIYHSFPFRQPLTLQAYLTKRMKEENIIGLDVTQAETNQVSCNTFVDDYFTHYLTKEHRHQSSTMSFSKTLNQYSAPVQEWLTALYLNYEINLPLKLNTYLKVHMKEKLFFLYQTDEEFKVFAFDFIRSYFDSIPLSTTDNALTLSFLKEYQLFENGQFHNPAPITDEVDEWIDDVFKSTGINLWTFVKHFLDYTVERVYTFQSILSNVESIKKVFLLNTIYINVSEHSILYGKKDLLETMMMYMWVHYYKRSPKTLWKEYLDALETS